MNPDTILQIKTGGDPFLEVLKWIMFVAILVFAAANPVMAYVRKFKSDTSASAKDEASVTLYTQLQEQLLRLCEQVRTLETEKNQWFQEATLLRGEVADNKRRIAELEEGEQIIKTLRQKLEEKDLTIEQRGAENRSLTLEVMSLKDRLHVLELRLLQDEASFCENCTFGSKRVVVTP